MVIYLYTGNGAGKTTNALGAALRSIGHGHKVVIIQFMKWWKNTGEYKVEDKLKPNYEIHQFGKKGRISLGELDEEDEKLAEQGLDFARKTVRKKPELLVLDEINLAIHCNLLDINEVVEFLSELPEGMDVFLTGRHAPQELVEISDCVTEIIDVKYPSDMPFKEGIQY